jgi:hypothetical protein
MPRPVAVIHPGPGVDIVRSRAGGIPIHRGAVIHQGARRCAPTRARHAAFNLRNESIYPFVRPDPYIYMTLQTNVDYLYIKAKP